MKILLISDTHGNLEDTHAILARYPDMDAYIHLGDIGFSCKELSKFQIVKGNHDTDTKLLNKHKFHFERRHIICIHGNIFDDETMQEVMNMHDVSSDKLMELCMYTLYKKLAAYAKRKGCDTMFFGHTHHQCMEEIDGVVLINPGSVNFGTPYSGFAVVDIHEKEIDVVFHKTKDC